MQISPERREQSEIGSLKQGWMRCSYLSLVVNLELLDFARQMQQPPIDRYTRGRWNEDIAMQDEEKELGERKFFLFLFLRCDWCCDSEFQFPGLEVS